MTPPRRPLGFEVALVVLVAAAILVPGIWTYSLVDPWETHYGEVAREMVQNDDFVHTTWYGTSAGVATDNEGFRSKPVLMFWMMSAGLTAVGHGDGGYSGAMVSGPHVMIGIRLPFILAAICGLTLVWWMLARLVSRRLAWLALLVVGTSPIFSMIARNAMPDMPMTACTMGAVALFIMAIEDGERPIAPITTWFRGRFTLDARHVVAAIAFGFVAIQAGYYLYYFARNPRLGLPGRILNPAIWLPPAMVLLVALQLHTPWSWITRRAPLIVRRLLGMAPLTQMRQVYLLGCYFLLGVCLLAKGPPGVAVVAGVGVFYVVLTGRWRALWEGAFELKRGILLMAVVAVPWHVAMFLVEGRRFFNEYIGVHILDRASADPDNSVATFEHYTSQIGHGMWLWAALLPAAFVLSILRSDRKTREGRVRFLVTLWAVVATSLFCLVHTKFHHYILPAIPPLALLVAFLLDDVMARRVRLHPAFAAIGVALALFVCRDLMFEPDRWVEMFVFRYDRPWPSGSPWEIDPSDGFLALGLAAAIAIAFVPRFPRLGVALVGGVGLAICIWALQVYMPIAGTHWGMGDAIRTYYEERSIYGQRLVYFSPQQLRDDWADVTNQWTFETFVPHTLHVGQPMTLDISLQKVEDERQQEGRLQLVGTATAIGDHRVTITLHPGERGKLDPWLARATGPQKYRVRRAIRAVDADRLLSWQLYWRGDHFWSGNEIWTWLPEMKTAFANTANTVEALKYLNDRTRAPLGRRYFVITNAGGAPRLGSVMPTARAKETYEVLDSTSNKFWLGAFWL